MSSEDTFKFFVNFVPKIGNLEFPINNLLSTEVLKAYQLIFRYLFTFRLKQFELKNDWTLHMKQKSIKNSQYEKLVLISSKIRTKILSFIDGLLTHWQTDIIHKSTIEF